MRTIYVLTVAVIVVCLAGPVQAALVTVGDPIEGDSWRQRFQESGVGLYDFMAVKMLSADAFEDPVFRNFSKSGWSNIRANDPTKYGVAQGTQQTYMQFDIAFAGGKTTVPHPDFLFVAFLGDTLLEEARVKWTGIAWQISASQMWQPSKAQVLGEAIIPEPASLLVWSVLGGFGALWACRRKRRLA